MVWCFDCLYMCLCGPCALERRYGEDKNCGCTCSQWSIYHVLCHDPSSLMSYGYWISRQNKDKNTNKNDGNNETEGSIKIKKPSEVSCYDLCCVPCEYATEFETYKKSKSNEIELQPLTTGPTETKLHTLSEQPTCVANTSLKL